MRDTLIELPLVSLDCRYGKMLSFRADEVIGRSLSLYGEWAEHELSCLRPYVEESSTIVDVGANIGTHTLAFSTWATRGRVTAIEAQPLVSAILSVNCFQNQRQNVEVVNCLASNHSGWMNVQVDYLKTENVGAISFSEAPDIRQNLGWFRRMLSGARSTKGSGVVQIRKLDDIVRAENVSLIKLDIEGMELDALLGARRLLRRCRPVLYFEQLNTDRVPELYAMLSREGYSLYWLETQPFNSENFNRVTENIWWRTETGILALPEHREIRNDLRMVSPTDQEVPHELDARAGTKAWENRILRISQEAKRKLHRE